MPSIIPTMPRSNDRKTLDRRRVLEAALYLVDREGLDRLTMRRLGDETGVEAMSLYNHVENKDDVLDGIVGLLWEKVEASIGEKDRTWQDLARTLARSIREVAHTHPNAYPLVLTRGQLPEEVIRLGARLEDALSRAGFGELASYATLALASHATSQAMAEVSWYGSRIRDEPQAQVGQWPPLVAAEDRLPEHDRDTAFELGLNLMVEALEQRIPG